MPDRVWSPYCGAAPGPADFLSRWNADPLLLIAIVVAMAAYASLLLSGRVQLKRPIAVPLVFALCIFLFVSPFCALTSALFSARVLHHVMLTAVVAPLVVLAFPATKIGNSHVFYIAPALYAAVFWFWHIPVFYEYAMSSAAIYWAMQATLFASAAWLWASIRAAPALIGLLSLVTSMMQMGLLGAVLTFAPQPLYAPHLFTTAVWNLQPLTDQQIGGVLMWTIGAGAYMAAAMFIAFRLLSGSRVRAAC